MTASDNCLLSLVIGEANTRTTALVKPTALVIAKALTKVAGTEASLGPARPRSVADYVAASMASSTLRAYQSDLHAFVAWGGSIPASADAIAAYLAAHGDALAPVTLSRRLVAIGRAHAALGHANPCRADVVRATMRGICRVHGRAQRQVRPVLLADLLAMLPFMSGTRGLRDRALLLIGFAGALRRSELVGLNYEDIALVKQGLTVMIRRSKTDQVGEGRRVAIPYASSIACPVQALTCWLDHARIQSGPMFRIVNKGGGIGDRALTPQSVALVVKEYAAKAGLNPAIFSGHSLRAGLITSAAKAGVSNWKIRDQSGHRSDAMLQRYVRDAAIFDGNAAGSLL